MKTLASLGGRFRLAQLYALTLGGNVQCGAHQYVCEFGIPAGSSYLY